MTIRLDSGMRERLERLSEVLKMHPGSVKVEFEIDLPDLGRTVRLDGIEAGGVEPSGQFFDDVRGVFGRTDFMEIRS
jgi:predicted transcriptional regulator